MKAIYVSDELHRQAKSRAAEAGIPLKDLIETWLQQGLHGASPEASGSLRESAAVYEVPTLVETMPQAPRVRSMDLALEDLERRGVLVCGERLREQFQAEYRALRKILGITSPPDFEPPSIDEVRAIFQRQRELYPDAPTVGEIIRQMREEE